MKSIISPEHGELYRKALLKETRPVRLLIVVDSSSSVAYLQISVFSSFETTPTASCSRGSKLGMILLLSVFNNCRKGSSGGLRKLTDSKIDRRGSQRSDDDAVETVSGSSIVGPARSR